MSYDQYESCARRIRASGQWFPRFHELLRGDGLPPEVEAAQNVYSDFADEEALASHGMPDDYFADEEPTQSGKAPIAPEPVIVAAAPAKAPPEERKPLTVDEEIGMRRDKAQISQLKSTLADALDKLSQCRLQLMTATQADHARAGVTPLKPREKASSLLREAVAVAMASDWHIEEQVDPASVNGVNEYNVEIAKHRVERFFSGFSYLIRYHQDHFAIRDGILWLGGDLITGYLREENLEHNLLSPVQAIATLHVWIADGIRSLLQSSNLESLRVVCNSGNHGRLTDKVRPSTREANSIEWLLYTALAREFANDPRVEFTLPYGSQTYVQVYDWTIRFLHGDDVKFGGGIGGLTVPLYKALGRWATFRHADITCLGHFHQYVDTADFVVNGSLIGYNPYALSIGARFEQPRQAFFLVDRRRGKTMPSDIWVTDSPDEEDEEA